MVKDVRRVTYNRVDKEFFSSVTYIFKLVTRTMIDSIIPGLSDI
jgi:hypothetical protein